MMLLFKKYLVQLVRSGKKRQTIRLWTSPRLRAGQISYTPGLGRMKITAVDILPSLAALTEADARDDGFESLAGLLAEIRAIYGERPAGRTIYRIRFEWPIDEAGEKLVLAAPDKVAKPPATTTAVPRTTTPGMTSSQRQTLRSFIVKQDPR
jgi:hypothetical protein